MSNEQSSANQTELQDKQIEERMSLIGKKIIVMSGKGGVGKTTVTVNLANALADKGYKVGILDTDLHGPNVAKMLGCEKSTLESPDGKTMMPIKVRDNLCVISLSFAIPDSGAPVIWRGPMKIAAIKQFIGDVEWGILDYLLIDTPPGTGDEQLTAIQSIPGMTGSVIVTTPQEVALLDARKSVNFSKKLNLRIIGIVENMSGLICPHCGDVIPLFGMGGGVELATEAKVPYLGRIPIEINLRENEDTGKSPLEMNPDSESSKALRSIADLLDSSTEVGDPNDYIGTNKCSPASCASCSSNCSSREK
ncbi:MAG: Mrp/NBP35 family ATP-binding protein [Sphaerochaetaceae bacterium]|nr:Mrp/NBP35 family ATP-binding protein [Sphaerochaetaceae bacterium]